MTAHDFSWQAVSSPGNSQHFFEYDMLDFVPNADFNLSNAWWMAQLCWLAYVRDMALRRALLANHGWSEIASWNNKVDACLLLKGFGAHVIVFRGTQGWRPWKTNLFYGKQRPKGGVAGKVHGGFQAGLMGVWSDVLPVLETISGPIFYTGHSRGGAMAKLACGFRPGTAVYAFGAPFVGNAVFAKEWTHPCYNVVNFRDFVPRVLLPDGWRFERIGDYVWLTPRGLVRNPSKIAWAKEMPKKDQGLRWVGQLLSPCKPPGSLSDHAPANYVANIECALAGKPLLFHDF